MNIWIFDHYAVPPDLAGGTRHYDMGSELVRRGHQVTVIATSFRHQGHDWQMPELTFGEFISFR